MKVSIIGQGYVGLTISAFASKHYQVVGFDLNSSIVAQLNKGISHIEGVSTEDIKQAIYAGNYLATTDGSQIAGSEIVVIAVPTPLDINRKPDLTYIDSIIKISQLNVFSQANDNRQCLL